MSEALDGYPEDVRMLCADDAQTGQQYSFKWHLANTSVGKKLNESQIANLESQLPEMEEYLQTLQSLLDEHNPNVQVLAMTRKLQSKFQAKNDELKSLEIQLSLARAEYESAKKQRTK